MLDDLISLRAELLLELLNQAFIWVVYVWKPLVFFLRQLNFRFYPQKRLFIEFNFVYFVFCHISLHFYLLSQSLFYFFELQILVFIDLQLFLERSNFDIHLSILDLMALDGAGKLHKVGF